MMNNDEILGRLSGKLKEILIYGLNAGNIICEAKKCNWPYPDTLFIMLKKPFTPPVYKDIAGIEFNNINDPHYWKAEYYDSVANVLLACSFGGKPNYKDL